MKLKAILKKEILILGFLALAACGGGGNSGASVSSGASTPAVTPASLTWSVDSGTTVTQAQTVVRASIGRYAVHLGGSRGRP